MLTTLLLCSLLCATLCSAGQTTWPQNYVVTERTETSSGVVEHKLWFDSTKLWMRVNSGPGDDMVWACFELGCVTYTIYLNQPHPTPCVYSVFMQDQFWDKLYNVGGWAGSMAHMLKTGLDGYSQTSAHSWVKKGSNNCGAWVNRWNLTDAGLPSSWFSDVTSPQVSCTPWPKTYYYDFQAQDPQLEDFKDIVVKNCGHLKRALPGAW